MASQKKSAVMLKTLWADPSEFYGSTRIVSLAHLCDGLSLCSLPLPSNPFRDFVAALLVCTVTWSFASFLLPSSSPWAHSIYQTKGQRALQGHALAEMQEITVSSCMSEFTNISQRGTSIVMWSNNKVGFKLSVKRLLEVHDNTRK